MRSTVERGAAFSAEASSMARTNKRCGLRVCAWVLAQTALACSGGEVDQPIAPGVVPPSTSVEVVAEVALDPGRKDMHRLNTAEYNATVQDVLGTMLEPANASWRGGELAGFDNMAAVLGVDEVQYERYSNAAKTLARELFATDALRARFFSCEVSDPSCARPSIEGAGLRLFRRPLTTDEVETYQRVYDASVALGDTPAAALELVLVALLSSAEFLYRIEFDPEPGSLEAHPLSPFEFASRLSYFLWSSAPDEALLQAAADASLTDPVTLAATVDRMLDDPKSERFIVNFAGQWLGARQVLSHPVATGLEQWPPELARGASTEMLLYFGEFLRSGRSWFEFLQADVNYVNDWLALHYEMPSPREPVERLEFTTDERAGFFGLAGFLALSSFDRRTSPSLRGRWVVSNFLCTIPPNPPANVPKLEEDGADLSTLDVRQLLERHSSEAGCVACHALFDPYGLALEEFDALGRYRSTYADGTPIDASARLAATDTYPEGLAFSGLAGLSQVVAADPRFGPCLAEKLFTYGMGRPVGASDAPSLEQARAQWGAAGEVPNIRRLVHALVATDAFRLRRGESEGLNPL
jgi:hypothetical protein